VDGAENHGQCRPVAAQLKGEWYAGCDGNLTQRGSGDPVFEVGPCAARARQPGNLRQREDWFGLPRTGVELSTANAETVKHTELKPEVREGGTSTL